MRKTVWVVVSCAVVLAAAAGTLALRGGSGSEEGPAAGAGEPSIPEALASAEASASADASATAEGELEIVGLAQASAPMADGLIAADEYRHRLDDPQSRMTLCGQNDETTLHVALVSPGTGWAGVGFSNRTGKPGSNIIIGAVQNGQVTIQDNYGVAKSAHMADQMSCLLATAGSEVDGQTTLEFRIPLASADPQDVSLVPGQTVQVILAYQAKKDSFTAEHTRYSMTGIVLD